MMRRLTAAALAVALAAGCSAGAPADPAPEPPATTLHPPARAPWGGATVVRVGALAGHIHDQLRDPYGAVKERPYVARDAAAVAGLEGWYAGRLGKGWTRKPLALPPEEHGFAFTAGDRAIAVGWLDRLPDGRVPVVVMRYGEKDGR